MKARFASGSCLVDLFQSNKIQFEEFFHDLILQGA